MLREEKGSNAREGGRRFGRCYVAAWCQGSCEAWQRGVCHNPSFPTAAGERGGIECEGKEGEMNEETVGGEATETYARDNLPIYHSPVLIKG